MTMRPIPSAPSTIYCRGKDYAGNFRFGPTPPLASQQLISPHQPQLPFDLPSRSDLLAAAAASGKEALIHYFLPLIWTLGNNNPMNEYWKTQYLNPLGDGSNNGTNGGYVRQSPWPMTSIPTEFPCTENFRQSHARHELALMRDLGITVVAFDILPGETGPAPYVTWAHEIFAMIDDEFPDMKSLIMLDLNHSAISGDMAGFTAKFLHYTHLMRNPMTGRVVLSCFDTTKPNGTGTMWAQCIDEVFNDYGVALDVLHVAQILGDTNKLQMILDDMGTLAPRLYCAGQWGDPIASAAGRHETYQIQVESGTTYSQVMDFCMPMCAQVHTPKAGASWYFGVQNLDGLLNQCEKLIQNNPRYIQVVTWNDRSEGTEFNPGQQSSYLHFDVMAYHIWKWIMGVAPTISEDTLMYCHREMLTTATAQPGAVQTVPLVQGSGVFDDKIQIITFLKAPATVEVEFNGVITTQSMPAGFSHFKIDAVAAEAPIFRLLRYDGPIRRVILELESHTDIADTYDIQDMTYHGGSSRRMRPHWADADPTETLFPSSVWRYGHYKTDDVVHAMIQASDRHSPFPRLSHAPRFRFESLDATQELGMAWSHMPAGYAKPFEVVADFCIEAVDSVTGFRMVGEQIEGTDQYLSSTLLLWKFAPGAMAGEFGYVDSSGADVKIADIEVDHWYRLQMFWTGVEAGGTCTACVYGDNGELIASSNVALRESLDTDVQHWIIRNSSEGLGSKGAIHLDNVFMRSLYDNRYHHTEQVRCRPKRRPCHRSPVGERLFH